MHALDVAHEVRSGYGGVRALTTAVEVDGLLATIQYSHSAKKNVIIFGRMRKNK